MTLRRGWFPMLGYNALLILSCLSCTDPSLVGPGAMLPLKQPAAVAHLAGRIECTATVRTGEITCTLDETRPPAGISATLLGSSKVELASSNVHYDTLSTVFNFDATVKNLLATPIGTLDGTTKTGLKVVYHEGPTPTSYYAPGDTGTITVMNADGRVNFTRKDQPYHFYDTILLPNQTSAPLNWKHKVPRTVNTFSFTVLVYAAIPGEPQVPAVPPNMTPSWVYADSNLARNSPHMSGEFPKNVLWLGFHEGTTPEEKQAAIDFAGGEVVGGSILADRYVVRVQDDGTTTPLFDAIRKLKTLPQVRFVAAGGYVEGLHLRPNDGPNEWGKVDWKLDPDSARGAKWGLERISAPYAWGCETGDPSVKVAVIDYGFHGVSDLRQNTPDTTLFGRMPDTIDHGTLVASVLAARGDDGNGMTGMMWRAHLELYEPYALTDGKPVILYDSLTEQIIRAGISADIINISLGINWKTKPGAAKDIERVTAAHEHVRDALRTLATTHNRRPLVVIAAGNDTIDAYWSGTPNVAADPDLANQVIVVGASDSLDHRADFSNYNVTKNLVRVMAPGKNVGALGGDGYIYFSEGTSEAAPYVTGLAGLLKSFDSRLTAAELKQFILAGANRSGRNAGGIPIINAYESLKLAAQNPGAPLCGTRVWTTGRKVFAQRKTGPEELFEIPNLGEDIDVLHGGRHIRVWTVGHGTKAFALENQRWGEIPDTLDSSLMGGTFLSRFGFSHDRDSWVIPGTRNHTNSGYIIDITLYDRHTQTNTVIASIPRTITINNSTRYCTREQLVPIEDSDDYSWECTSFGNHDFSTYSESDFPIVAYAPAGDRILLAVNRTVTRLDGLSSWEACPGSGSAQCRSVYFSGESLGAEFYTIDIRTKQATRKPNMDLGNVDVEWMGIAEDGREFVAGTSTRRGSSVFEWTSGSRQTSRNLQDDVLDCTVNYRNFESKNPLYTINPNDGCVGLYGTATMNKINATARELVQDPNGKALLIRRD